MGQLNTQNCILPFHLVHFSSVDEANDSAIFLQHIHPAFRKGRLNLQRASFVFSLSSYHLNICSLELDANHKYDRHGKIKQMAGWLPNKVASKDKVCILGKV